MKLTRILISLGVASLIVFQSCALQKGYVIFAEKPDEIITTHYLKSFFKANPNPTIVLRAPNSSSSTTESDYNGQIYNTIEKELMNGGFNVKDRALFNEVLGNNEGLNYKQIYERTKTDLILELTNIDRGIRFRTNKIYSKYNKQLVYKDYSITRIGALIEFKIILLVENRMIGNYSFYYSPCTLNNGDCRCAVGYKERALYPYHNYCNDYKNVAYETVDQNDMNEFVRLGIKEFINEIKN